MATDMLELKSSITPDQEKRLECAEGLMRLKTILEEQEFAVIERLEKQKESYENKGVDPTIVLQLETHIERLKQVFGTSFEQIKLAQFEAMSPN